MNDLIDFGVDPDLTREDMITALLRSSTTESLRGMREKMFDIAQNKGLVHPKDILVKRLKRSVGPTLETKYATDIADLCYVIRNDQLVPRTLLKNGKRSAATFVSSRSGHSNQQGPSNSDSANPSPNLSIPHDGNSSQANSGCNSPDNSNNTYSERNRDLAISSLVRELGSLRRDITELKSEVSSLKNNSSSETCVLYVRLKNIESADLCESIVNTILNCSTICYSIISNTSTISLRVRILKSHLHSALTSTNAHVDIVSLWKLKRNTSQAEVIPSTQSSIPHHSTTFNLTTWNCRGLQSGEPYIYQLADSGCDIIAVSEHWLWPYEAARLHNIHPGYTAEIKIDKRLTENSTLKRGCGGVGIVWKKNINATPIPSIISDRICGIHVKSPTSDTVDITVIAVYLPCANLGMEIYGEHLIELECVISEYQPHGPVIIMGDFNAHLGVLGGERGLGQPNPQGILLHQLIKRCNLYAVSLTSLSEGPVYTFQNSVSQTTVDYVLASHNASQYIQQCYTHNLSPLNTSDHLPITTLLQFTHSTLDLQDQSTQERINWSKARDTIDLHRYQKRVGDLIAPLMGHTYKSCQEIDNEIKFVTDNIYSAALEYLPLIKNSTNRRKWYKDQTLSRLALAKKAAWDKWSANGRQMRGIYMRPRIEQGQILGRD